VVGHLRGPPCPAPDGRPPGMRPRRKRARRHVVLPYRPTGLRVFSRYLQGNWWMESLGGKNGLDRAGQVGARAWPCTGQQRLLRQARHTVQQLRDGIEQFLCHLSFEGYWTIPPRFKPIDGELGLGDFLDGFLQWKPVAALMKGGPPGRSASPCAASHARALGALVALFEPGPLASMPKLGQHSTPRPTWCWRPARKAAAYRSGSAKPDRKRLLRWRNPRLEDDARPALGLESPEPIFWILRHLCGNDRGYSAEVLGPARFPLRFCHIMIQFQGRRWPGPPESRSRIHNDRCGST